MSVYNRILAIVDLSPDGGRVMARARQLAEASSGATLTLLHVVEFMPVEPLSDSLLPSVQIEADLLQMARQRMATLATTAGSPTPAWEVVSGNVKAEVVRFARTGGFDLIVVGSHERHGLSILVNLTEDTVLHAAPCDVLAVRLTQAEQPA
ncbi:MAG: universal stress protein [Steroidobacteraceae bacterium]